MYVVRNLTKRTIILSDLRAEIGPLKMLDLEKVAHREAIERSADLRTALQSRRLRLMSNGVKSVPEKEIQVIEKITEKIIEKHIEKPSEDGMDEKKLEAMMRRILAEQTKEPTSPKDNTNVILNAVAALKEQLANISSTKDGVSDMPDIDPVLFADLQSKAIEKISETIETGSKKVPKKVKLKNTRSTDLASELD